ncbi:branched-chain amino acid transporter AzlD [Aminipila terrae]|uniref:Branched-chain amino acid transporter AzlD n=1 Tax=Aminipila terrae TaxID=2697030 RepID=A0A6P1MIK6_9FIRM|nr:branched-chain amino acid transporter AzlD [Aminipila terrae]
MAYPCDSIYAVWGQKELPETVEYLGNVLPASIMIILVIYCLRNINFTAFPFGAAELISVGVVIAAQVIRKDSIISMVLGTACYMILIRTAFPA